MGAGDRVRWQAFTRMTMVATSLLVGASRFRQYTNLASTEPRVRRLLREFRFAPIRDVLREHPVTAAATDVGALRFA